MWLALGNGWAWCLLVLDVGATASTFARAPALHPPSGHTLVGARVRLLLKSKVRTYGMYIHRSCWWVTGCSEAAKAC